MGNNKTKTTRPATGRADSPVLPVIRPMVAGIDIGSREHWVAGPRTEAANPNVKVFRTTSEGLNELADWLVSQGVESVAMESTSVYWIPLYELLESRKVEVLLVNAHQLRNVPGRKTDMHDCQWIQVLHSCGLLRGSFRPPEEIARIRAIHRQMTNLVGERTRTIQWMQKALDQMNVQVHHAVSDLAGVTGLAIVRAIVDGQRDPAKLAALRDHRCQKSEEAIGKHLTGTWRDEHLFNLASALRMFDVIESEIERYQSHLDELLKRLVPEDKHDAPVPPHPNRTKAKSMAREGKEPRRDLLYRATGVDLTRIDGIGPDAATTIVDEVGIDLRTFPSEHHFVSWLRLCPRTAISGGKPLHKRKRKGQGAQRVAAVLRMAATTLARSKSALGAYYRRTSRLKDAATAVLATARKLACFVYRMLRHGQEYVDVGEKAFELAAATRRLKALHASARALGYDLVPTTTQPTAEAAG